MCVCVCVVLTCRKCAVVCSELWVPWIETKYNWWCACQYCANKGSADFGQMLYSSTGQTSGCQIDFWSDSCLVMSFEDLDHFVIYGWDCNLSGIEATSYCTWNKGEVFESRNKCNSCPCYCDYSVCSSTVLVLLLWKNGKIYLAPFYPIIT